MPDLAALQLALSELQDDLEEQNNRIARQNELLTEQNTKLGEVEKKLPTFVPRSRFAGVISLVVFAGVMVAAFSAISLWVIKTDAREDRRRDQIAGASRAFANCESVNRAFNGVDIGYTALAAQALANAEDDAHRERIRESHRRLRSGLARTDCTGHLSQLSAADAERVRDEASRTVPTLPLPPPPTAAP